MANIWVFNGPNLNLLGRREPNLYGNSTLQDLQTALNQKALVMGHTLTFWQGHDEGAAIGAVHAAIDNFAGVIINPAAWTHTSVALRDAFTAWKVGMVEVHISNIAAREPFRRVSYFSDICIASISGCGLAGYDFALCTLDNWLKERHI